METEKLKKFWVETITNAVFEAEKRILTQMRNEVRAEVSRTVQEGMGYELRQAIRKEIAGRVGVEVTLKEKKDG